MAHETESEAIIQRESSNMNLTPKMKSIAYSDGNDVDSGMMSHVMSRMANGPFPVSNLPLAGDHAAMFGGQMISPTHPQGPLQFIHPQVRHYRHPLVCDSKCISGYYSFTKLCLLM